MMKNIMGIILVLFSISAFADDVEKWGMFELSIPGFTEGNPFIGIDLKAEFTDGERIFSPEGFYDGNGTFKIRFMPDKEGLWTYQTHSNRKELDNIKGQFSCTPPAEDNRGPVRIRDQYHFGYADGTPFYPFGTTIYEWVFQTQETRNQTLETLQSSPFNKVRFLLVPPYSEKYVSGPLKLTDFPFEGTSKATWNFSRFNVDFWQHFESCLQQILDLGIQADIILFRPYDDGKWGFDTMDDATNDRFTRYAVARLAAFRNVWWSLANENSFMDNFTEKDWDRLFKIVRDKDPYAHLCSIHNAGLIYDYTKPWVTHVSLQYYNVVRAFGASALVRDIYRKAVVNDEINYEGDIASRWGQLSGEEMVYRFWLAYTGGTYATHGEAFEHPSEINWISEGGVLRGQSPSRIAFLRQIIENSPPGGWHLIDHYYLRNVIGQHAHTYLYYFGKENVKQWDFGLPDEGLEDGMQFKVDLIDTWNMTITPVKEIFTVEKLDRYQYIDIKKRSVRLPGKPYMAMRIQRIDTGDKDE